MKLVGVLLSLALYTVAMGQETISCGDEVQGSLDNADEDIFEDGTRADVYTLTLDGPQLLTATMTGEFECYVSVFDDGNEPLLEDRGDIPGDPAIASGVLQAGEYRVIANNYLPTILPATYSLELSCEAQPTPTPIPCSESDSAEPDNTPEQGYEISATGTHMRTLEGDGDVDWYKITTVLPTYIEIQTSDLSGTNPDTVLEVYVITGEMLLINDNYPGGSRLYWQAGANSVYYAKVRTFGGFSNRFDDTGGGPGTCCYTIDFTLLPYNARNFGDYNFDRCSNLEDFLLLLDNWQEIYAPIGQPVLGLSDFLSLLDNWQTGPGC